jgi:hypothetical protein
MCCAVLCCQLLPHTRAHPCTKGRIHMAITGLAAPRQAGAGAAHPWRPVLDKRCAQVAIIISSSRQHKYPRCRGLQKLVGSPGSRCGGRDSCGCSAWHALLCAAALLLRGQQVRTANRGQAIAGRPESGESSRTHSRMCSRRDGRGCGRAGADTSSRACPQSAATDSSSGMWQTPLQAGEM